WSDWWPFNFPAEPLSSDPSAGNAEQMAAFSSRGPTLDGRIKPDLVAPGSWVLSGFSDLYQFPYDASPNPQNGFFQYSGWGYPLNDKLKYLGGTSMSAPLVAGGAAVVRDFYQELHGHAASAALVKATLVNSAQDLLDEDNDGVNNNALAIPNFYEGWGRADLAAATDGSRQFVDQTAGLATGGVASFTYDVAAGTPLKVTLVWSDYPGDMAAFKMLVNNLDLEVSGPGGAFYRGNVFGGGWSIAGGLVDDTNNVENVYVQTPAAGSWTVTVRGFNVPQGPQPFALVVAGQLDEPPPVTHVLTIAPPSNGTVTSGDGFITCGSGGSACSHAYDEGSVVVLSTTANLGFVRTGWTGDCAGSGATCTLTMDQAHTAGATFAPNVVTLSITNVSVSEGASGTTAAVLTVSLSGVTGVSVTVDFATADGTATTAGNDYVAQTGNLNFTPGQVSKTIQVSVNGDTTVEPNETLFVNLSNPVGATIADAQGQITITNDDGAGLQPVIWISPVGVTVSGNSLTKTAAIGWGNSGAISSQQIAADGHVEVTGTANSAYRMIGLSNGNSSNHHNDIDFALCLCASELRVYEAGVLRGTFGAFATGNLLRVAVAGATVTYSKNGVVFYTSTVAPTHPLLVDAALYSTGATLNNAVIGGGPPPPAVPVVWTSPVGLTVSGNSLTKTAAVGWGNSGAVSSQQITGDGYVEVTGTANSTYRMFGLSNGSSSNHYDDIDYAFCECASQIRVYEGGVLKGTFGNFATGNLLRVAVAGSTVTYSRNGVVFYTSTVAPTRPLLVDAALHSTGATINNAVISMSP
ncbi:MAG: Calx-beta domain-containing protein, partial [Burkholderiales bacterium]